MSSSQRLRLYSRDSTNLRHKASLGGYLAPRAASDEPLIAALIADPATWSIVGDFSKAAVQHFGVSQEDAKHLSELDDAVLAKMEGFVSGNPALRWKVMQRGYWVHGVDNFRDFLRAAEPFTIDGRAELIHCPTLLTMAEKGLNRRLPRPSTIAGRGKLLFKEQP